MVANFFEVDIRTISRYLEQNTEELVSNGYQILKGKKLKEFMAVANNSGKDINVPAKTTVLGIFDIRAFLNMAMLLSESSYSGTQLLSFISQLIYRCSVMPHRCY